MTSQNLKKNFYTECNLYNTYAPLAEVCSALRPCKTSKLDFVTFNIRRHTQKKTKILFFPSSEYPLFFVVFEHTACVLQRYGNNFLTHRHFCFWIQSCPPIFLELWGKLPQNALDICPNVHNKRYAHVACFTKYVFEFTNCLLFDTHNTHTHHTHHTHTHKYRIL